MGKEFQGFYRKGKGLFVLMTWVGYSWESEATVKVWQTTVKPRDLTKKNKTLGLAGGLQVLISAAGDILISPDLAWAGS